MPVRDWSRVGAGIFHDFHLAWIAELRAALSGGLLPPDDYALAEQHPGEMGPDVLTLQSLGPAGPTPPPSTRGDQEPTGATAVAEALPGCGWWPGPRTVSTCSSVGRWSSATAATTGASR